MTSDPLAQAEHALLHDGRPLTHGEVIEVAHVSLDRLPDLVALAHAVRLALRGPSVALEALANVKSGACPEDCAFCSQSAHYKTGADVTPFLSVDLVLPRALAAEDAGASHFCLVVASGGPDERTMGRVLELVGAIRARTRLEVACSLGLLTPDQARRLAGAGVARYNHNLETCRELFPRVCTSHRWEDRVETALLAHQAGMELCSGGILGLGETLEQRVDFAFELARIEPDEVPLNFFDPRPGTPLAGRPLLAPREALQAVALFRLVMPRAAIRLAGGRERVLGALQAIGLYAGADALVVGDYLTTPGQPVADDLTLLEALGMPVAQVTAAAAYVVESRGK